MTEQLQDCDAPSLPKTKNECKAPLVPILLICLHLLWERCMHCPCMMQWVWDCSASGQPLFHAYNDECQRVLEESYKRGDQVWYAFVSHVDGWLAHIKKQLCASRANNTLFHMSAVLFRAFYERQTSSWFLSRSAREHANWVTTRTPPLTTWHSLLSIIHSSLCICMCMCRMVSF